MLKNFKHIISLAFCSRRAKQFQKHSERLDFKKTLLPINTKVLNRCVKPDNFSFQ